MHNRIEFFANHWIKILECNIKFGSGAELLAPIRRLQNCKIEQRGDRHAIQNNDSHEVGELWFDSQASTESRDCVVVGMYDPDNCLILLLSIYDHCYLRVGAGYIKAGYISKDSWDGIIV